MNGRWRSGRYERKICSISRLWLFMGDTRVRVLRLMVDNDESSSVTADLTINLSSGFAVVLINRYHHDAEICHCPPILASIF
ncbi:hypothetical protein TNCV_154031 [Trichonephila clavipes]|nr:hypothetical protein TNCV_154031 [Trichonephila clavipes]